MTAQPVNRYDRQFDEAEDAWAAFYRYRDLQAPRPSPTAFAQSIGYRPERVLAWAQRYDWSGRIVAWDQRVDAARQGATLRGVEEMATRHIALAQKGLQAVEAALDKLLKDLGTDFGRLKPHEIARLLEVSSKLERLSRGEVTDRTAGGGPDYSKLTDQDLAFLEDVAHRVN